MTIMRWLVIQHFDPMTQPRCGWVFGLPVPRVEATLGFGTLPLRGENVSRDSILPRLECDGTTFLLPPLQTMDLRSVFINQHGRLRSGWRLLTFVAAAFACYVLFGVGVWIVWAIIHATGLRIPFENQIAELVLRFLILATALIAGYGCARFLEDLPWRSLGLTLHRHWFKDLLVGSVIGILSLSIAVLIAKLGGGFHFSLSSRAVLGGVVKSLAGSCVLFIIAALAEEAMFRGYPLQTLARAKLAWFGVLLTSVPFAAAHLLNPHTVPGFTFANTALAGVWLALAYLRTRSLWFPLGVHWSWNWALGSLYGLPVSGLTLVSHPLLRATDLGPDWLTGGAYGIEGGAACTVALIISSIVVWKAPLVSATPELMKLTSEENPATPREALSITPARSA
jgi:membrane protease YdiL (CAAX protease family)